ncbi:MFS transporter [Serratia sp. NA_13]|uniref:MFS transporter n=1 Tax=Serratia sp. NA_13 TaxID=3415658 RepID=UPI004046E1A0
MWAASWVLSTIGMSYVAGLMYVNYGFKTSYRILGCIALLFTLISAFALSGKVAVVKQEGVLPAAVN